VSVPQAPGPPQQDLYPEVSRDDVRPHIPRSARVVLDVGCSRGGFGPTLRGALGPTARIVGIEAVPQQAQVARVGHDFDEVVDGYFPGDLPGRDGEFDLVCFNDVLEHVVDPWELLRSTKRFLSPTGQILAAIPSVQFAPVVWQLIRGRWDYADTGTLDRTHLRFFTRATMLEMFADSGFRVELCVGANSLEDRWRHEQRFVRRLAKRALLTGLGDGKFVHFVVVASPTD